MLTASHLDQLVALKSPLHLALGFFDGVHIGHQAVISRAVDAARSHGGLAGVVTFHPHPCHLTNPANVPAPLVANLEHKAELVANLGVDLFVPLNFDLAMAKTPAESFIDHLVAAGAKTIAVGDDWRFGCGRLGDVAMLQARGALAGFNVIPVPMVTMDGERVSSTRIRQAIRDGAMASAARMLGRPYTVRGTVAHGRKLASQIGFPTANIVPNGSLMPPDGVWTVLASLSERNKLPGIANIGLRPTVDGTHRILEVHLFDFSGDVYGQPMEVEFLEHIRPEIRFQSIGELRDQIARDVESARQKLAH